MSDNIILEKPSVSNNYWNKLTLLNTKKDKLIFIIEQLLIYSSYAHHLQRVMEKSCLTHEQVIKSFLAYNLDLSVRDNEDYRGLENRFVLHAHNLIEGSWHQNKQKCITQAVQALPTGNIIDMGFGVPTQYIRDFALNKSSIKITLCDFDNVAFDFAKVLLDDWATNWREVVMFRNEDMNNMQYLGDYDAYLFQDCIEHTYDPTSYLSLQVAKAPSQARFIFILPIGPLIPMHYIAWETINAAKEWLSHCGLEIDSYTIIQTNPAIDLFASDTTFRFGFFNCIKR